MENKQTALEWFAEYLGVNSGDAFEQAKIMEQQQRDELATYYHREGMHDAHFPKVYPNDEINGLISSIIN